MRGPDIAQRRDTAIIAVFQATSIRLSELAGIRYDPGDPQRSDIHLWQREITVRGKGGKDRIVRIGHQAARSLDRYIRARSRHAQAWRPAGRRGRVPAPVPAPFQPHLAGPRRSRGRPDGTERLGLPADAPPLRRQRPQRTRPPQLRPHHDRCIRTPATPAGPGSRRASARNRPDIPPPIRQDGQSSGFAGARCVPR
jgi:integrase